jgi:hypothetical protein
MDQLNFPQYTFQISKTRAGKYFIFDMYRKKKVVLTPEEWVRQHMLRYLVEEKGFPASLISSESGIKVNQLSRRYDALVFDRKGKPLLLIECKATSVPVNQAVFDQVLAYNRSAKARYILVTNGLKHFCCRYAEQDGKYEFLHDIPSFNEL